MSKLYQNVLTVMLQNYDNTKSVESSKCQETFCQETFQCSTQCLTDIFRTHKNRIYNCKTITSMYILRFCNRYSSEIYHILNDIIPKLTTGDLILSIGCGSCMEILGIERYSRDNNLGMINYVGIDTNFIWQDASKYFCLNTQNISSKAEYNAIDSRSFLPKVKVFLFNYCLSDIKNHSNLNNFLCNDFSSYLELLPNDSYVIINDQNHGDEWEDNFDVWSSSLDTSKYTVTNYFFDPGSHKPCNPRGKRMFHKQLVFSNFGLDPRIEKYFQANLPCCESGITIIHKI